MIYPLTPFSTQRARNLPLLRKTASAARVGFVIALSRIGRVRTRSSRRKRLSAASTSSEIHVLWRAMIESGARVSEVALTFESVKELDAELARVARGAGVLRLGLA